METVMRNGTRWHRALLAVALAAGMGACTGRDGIDGINGQNGQNGQQGPAGPTGPTGPIGPTGPTGPSGPGPVLGGNLVRARGVEAGAPVSSIVALSMISDEGTGATNLPELIKRRAA